MAVRDGTSSKQVVTLLSVGVTAGFVLLSTARYLRYLRPVNCASVPPLAKKVAAVPSGPTNANGPAGVLLAPARDLTSGPAGVGAGPHRVPPGTIAPAPGVASLVDDPH